MVDAVNRSTPGLVPMNVDENAPPVDTKGAKEIKHAGALPLEDIKASSGLDGKDALMLRVLQGAAKDQEKVDMDAMMKQMSVPEHDVVADIFTFMALFQKLAQEMRNSNREIRTAELQGQISELQNAATEMR